MTSRERSTWHSTLGFILASSGAAIGLGNIQRFPYIAAEGGGAIFVFIYLFCIIFIGFPLVLLEFSLGRHTNRNPVCAIDKIKPKTLWKGAGFLGILSVFFVLSYYSVIAGWTLGYTINVFCKMNIDIKTFSQSPIYSIGYMALFIFILISIVIKGIRKGLERWNKILMPILFLVLLILMIRSISLPNSLEGLKYYLKPDFSEVTWKIFVLALGQAFFSLCICGAVSVTYGSYAKKTENLFSSASYIVFFDTLIAFLAGFIIFPAIFAFGETPAQGIALSFIILPKIFTQMPLGNIFGGLFFLLLSFAAITSGLSLLEIPVIYLIDSKKWSRVKSCFVVGLLAFLIGIPSALSQGGNSFFTNLHIKYINQKGFLSIMDFLWGNIGIVIAAGLVAIFTGWIWGAKNAARELKIGSINFHVFEPLWMFLVKYIIPIFIFIILINILI